MLQKSEEAIEEQHLFEMYIFCNSIHVFTDTFDKFNASLQNKSIHLNKALIYPYIFFMNMLESRQENLFFNHIIFNIISLSNECVECTDPNIFHYRAKTLQV